MRLLFLTLSFFAFLLTKAQTGRDILHKMHEKYSGKWYKTFTFVQTTEFYRNDSLKNTATWYEAAHFPYNFRIDVGDPKNGNGVIYKEDSTYYFQKGQLKRSEAGTNPFTFLLGGMYVVSFDSAVSKLHSQGYDLTKGYKTKWKGKNVFVIGAGKGDEVSKQFWVDAKDLYLVRSIEKEGDNRIDALMMDHIRVGKGWSETKVMIYFNGRLGQVEKYSNIKAGVPLDDQLFDPAFYDKVHWMN